MTETDWTGCTDRISDVLRDIREGEDGGQRSSSKDELKRH